jgi:hypothetical protein
MTAPRLVRSLALLALAAGVWPASGATPIFDAQFEWQNPCEWVAPASAAGGLTQAESQEFLDQHNQVRGLVSPPASPVLSCLDWDVNLATVAANWAATCPITEVAVPPPGSGTACALTHNANRSSQYAGLGGSGSVGENMFAAFPVGAATPAFAVTGAPYPFSWESEKVDYTYATNTCTVGRVCGHYTQLVWRNSLRLGCGTAECLCKGSTWRVMVCDYNPAGNVIGQWPY